MQYANNRKTWAVCERFRLADRQPTGNLPDAKIKSGWPDVSATRIQWQRTRIYYLRGIPGTLIERYQTNACGFYSQIVQKINEKNEICDIVTTVSLNEHAIFLNPYKKSPITSIQYIHSPFHRHYHFELEIRLFAILHNNKRSHFIRSH